MNPCLRRVHCGTGAALAAAIVVGLLVVPQAAQPPDTAALPRELMAQRGLVTQPAPRGDAVPPPEP